MIASFRFLAFCLFAMSLTSFSVGRICRFIVVSDTLRQTSVDAWVPPEELYAPLHVQIVQYSQQAPENTYGSKQLGADLMPETSSCWSNKGSINFAEQVTEEEIHDPAGQHLLVDVKNVNGVFLNSEERLAQAMISLVEMSGLTILSYHCHSLQPIGVSCAAILPESHVAFHTWPIPGVVALDVFTCGPKPLLPLLSYIEKLFAIPEESQSDGRVEPPHVQWAHKKRGFRKVTSHVNPEDSNMDEFSLGWTNDKLKTHVATINTALQTVDIFDVINPRFNSLESHQKSLSKDGSYELQHPELFRPERIVYLDKIMQSRLFGEAAYHEALVHPAMFAHDKPRRIAIIGSGAGATLREVLKHKTVKKLTMIEIDEGMVNASKVYLPEWSDCSNLLGSAPSCFDDPRAKVFYTDAIAWFIERFGRSNEVSNEADRYDVIIMDALDPSTITEFSDKLYDNQDFARAVYNALTESGVFVAQIGEAEYMDDPPRMYSTTSLDDIFIDHLENEGFEKIKDYTDELHGRFMGAWSFLLAFKDGESNEKWYANEAVVNLDIRYRILPTVTGESPLRFFDGATMKSYSYPSRIVEEVFCRNDPTPENCERGHGFDSESPNAPVTSFEVKPSNIPGAGRGAFYKQSFPKGTYIAIEEGVHSMLIEPLALRIITDMHDINMTSVWHSLMSYLHGYGFPSDLYGDDAYSVDPGILTFVNHGCNGTYNIGTQTSVTELTADPHHCPDDIESDKDYVYDPWFDRNHIMVMGSGEVTLRDVRAGEEVLDNYLVYENLDEWEWWVDRLRAVCLKLCSGLVTEYEQNGEGPSPKTPE